MEIKQDQIKQNSITKQHCYRDDSVWQNWRWCDYKIHLQFRI